MSERDIEHEAIRAELRIMLIQINAEFEAMNTQLRLILEQTQKTNGRVTSIEGDIDLIRLIKKYKWSAAVIGIGFIYFFKYIDVIQWISKFL